MTDGVDEEKFEAEVDPEQVPPDPDFDPVPPSAEALRRKKILKGALLVLGALFLMVGIGGLVFYSSVTSGLPDVTKLDQYDAAQTTKVFAADGTMIATLFDENRTPVKIDEVSEVMKQSIVAIEDRRFFEHGGVDLKGIARAALGNFSSGGVEQGASTLTMQLARRLFLTDERSYSRKLREAVLAYRMDSALSKDKILELYLNEVYFGSGAYGIDAAASLYFKINPIDLNLWQSALLAGLVQAPTAYSPLVDKAAALTRMKEVLAALEANKTITTVQKAKAEKEAAAYTFVNNGLGQSDGMLKYPYFTTYVVKQLSEHFPENYIRRGGLQVYTTLDIPLQETTEAAVRNEVLGPGAQLGADAGAAVVLNNQTGEIVAMTGGVSWNTENQFNRAYQAKRQPGSAFKMFVYAAALESGFNPEQEFADTEAVFSYDTTPWRPLNSDGQFMGAIPMRSGLMFSRNLVAAKVMAHVGPAKVISLARRMGIVSELPEVISLALGAGEITPLEMARAFSVLPNGGLLRPNRVLLKVTDAKGELLKDFVDSDKRIPERALSNRTAMLMCEMLRRVVTGGTGTSVNIPGAFIAGKTGTTDSFVDAWFVGFSPGHTISVWVGRDDNKPMGRVYGGTLPADIFRTIAEKALIKEGNTMKLPGVTFGDPYTAKLCWDSMYLALPTCPKTYSDTFSAGVVPTRMCPMHRQTKVETVVRKTSEGVLTNLNDDGSLLVSPTPTPDLISDELDPRKDPEVVTPAGARIPYLEKEPKGKVKVVEIKIEPKEYPTVEDDSDDAGGGKVILLDENMEPVRPDFVESSDPQTGYPVQDPLNSDEDPDLGDVTPSGQGTTSTEVIYTNQSLDIPPDPVGGDSK